ncbi:hypothetical protein DDB_G0276185 [Dictyostelium discoideum AX4]|uniref:hypothetical protein n=1 Tax=Dictyostelium discoideum AX4 TaxID=352472 RepID=UPI00004E3637|nr:hypothetical protein DDB_G0276185 [Dictyostelium discoideum AX4]EAL69392.1 hypothetical protein DDB_G0276185 [Dictyostelium discoideum AX4]|eukprot:XP_643303.1 hypothetical protein DDB_G0276185 [Dictyostelium discoideum AX4]
MKKIKKKAYLKKNNLIKIYGSGCVSVCECGLNLINRMIKMKKKKLLIRIKFQFFSETSIWLLKWHLYLKF